MNRLMFSLVTRLTKNKKILILFKMGHPLNMSMWSVILSIWKQTNGPICWSIWERCSGSGCQTTSKGLKFDMIVQLVLFKNHQGALVAKQSDYRDQFMLWIPLGWLLKIELTEKADACLNWILQIICTKKTDFSKLNSKLLLSISIIVWQEMLPKLLVLGDDAHERNSARVVQVCSEKLLLYCR